MAKAHTASHSSAADTDPRGLLLRRQGARQPEIDQISSLLHVLGSAARTAWWDTDRGST
jgi:hypothetical protein